MKNKAGKIRFASIEKIFSDETKRDSSCMFPNCSEKAIGSHVFSRAHILQPISNNNEIYQFNRRPLMYDDTLNYSLEPVRNAFTFKGFCQYQDTVLFKLIEPKDELVDWTKIESQYLLSYRTVCREIYANIAMQNVFNKLLTKEEIEKYNPNILVLQNQLTNLKLTKDTLDYCKSKLEMGIHNRNFTDIHFEYFELPFQFDLCVSAPIHVQDGKGICFNTDYQEINIVNIFPYYGKTIILFSYLDEFENRWMNEILPQFKSPYPHIVSNAFVDILYRAEFHAISPSLYKSLNKDLLGAFLRTWQLEANNYSCNIENKVSSLFYSPLSKLMSAEWKTL